MNKEQRFLDTVSKIYTLPLSDDGWQAGLGAIAELLDANCVSFEVINKRQGVPVLLQVGGEFDESKARQYVEYYSGISPRVRCVGNYATGEISYDYQILSEEEIDKDEYYNDFALPQGQRYFIGGHVLNNSSHMALFAAQRPPKQGHVSDEEIQIVQRLLPHIQQALDLKFRLSDLSPDKRFQHLHALTEAVIAINAEGKVVFCNHLAETIFTSKDGIDCQQDRLIFSDKNCSAKFRRGLQSLLLREGEKNDAPSRDFIVRRSSQKRPYLLSLRALGEVESNELNWLNENQAIALLFIRDPEYYTKLDTALLKTSFTLSPQELELALALEKGLSLQEVAQQRSVAISTVRSQLYSLMAKAGVNRQADLMRLLGQFRRPFQ